MSIWYNKTTDEVLQEQESNINGLSTDQITQRKLKYGTNAFDKRKKESLLKLILHPLLDISEIILLVAAALSFVMALRDGSGFLSPIVIVVVIVINVVLSVTQQLGAEKALEALNKLNSPQSYVIRDGVTKQIDTEDIVVGDILLLKTGDLISADCRIIECEEFLVDEASLTGESESVNKNSDVLDKTNAALGDQKNMLFSGTLVAGGHAKAVVVATGMNTQMGKIAGYLNVTKKQKTPLQARLDRLGKIVSIIAVIAAVIILALGLIEKQDLWQLSILAITLAVAAVPETLSVIVTLILTQGIKKMVSKNAIIRKLQAVETLGSTSVICSDKTGTLTQNKMTVKRLWQYGYNPISNEDVNTEEQIEFVKKLVLASNAIVEYQALDNGTLKEKIIGDPTESAILALAISLGIDIKTLRENNQRLLEIPFSSSRKMMSVVIKSGDKYEVITKGAFDRIPYTTPSLEYKTNLLEMHDSFAYDALRVITLASKTMDYCPGKDDIDIIESELDFVGLIGIIDPPRQDVKDAILRAKMAGIRTVMITGDHAATAMAIARELGIIAAREGVITGSELANLSDNELYDTVEYYSVYARVSPEDKIRIVQAWQRLGAVVSMTGDGVNDAPALKAADVGVSMGIAGTEVAKSASDMILTDDKFSTIVEAVSEGRNVFSNIRSLIYFLIVCNISEIMIMLFGVLLFREDSNWYLPVTPIMLLIVNIIGDGIPGMALAKEVSDKRIMKRKPIDRHESFFGGGMMEVIIQQAIAFAVVDLLAYYIGANVLGDGSDYARLSGQTMAFLVLGWTSVIHVFVVRSRKSVINKNFLSNPQLCISALAMFVVIALIAAIPFVNSWVGMVNIGFREWLIALGLSFVPIIVAEYGKFWDNYRYKTAEKNRVTMQKIDK